MVVSRKISKGLKFTNTKICEDYFYKCQILKRTNFAYCLDKYLTEYRIRKIHYKVIVLKNIYWIWFINKKI